MSYGHVPKPAVSTGGASQLAGVACCAPDAQVTHGRRRSDEPRPPGLGGDCFDRLDADRAERHAIVRHHRLGCQVELTLVA